MTILTKFGEALKARLRDQSDYWRDQAQYSVGCSTCGDYEIVETVNWDELNRNIDELIASFNATAD